MNDNKLLKKGQKCSYAVDGMHCAACELTIEKELAKSHHMKNVNAVLDKKRVFFEIENDVEENALITEISDAIREHGYSVGQENVAHKFDYNKLQQGFFYALLVIGGFLLLQKAGLGNFLGGDTLSLPLVFFIGIIASVSSCMAVVGGLVLSISSSYAKSSDKTVPLVFFHLARIVAFFIFGGVLGYLGSLFRLGPGFYLFMGIVLFGVMFVLGMNLLDIFPIFRRFQLRMPKTFAKKVTGIESVKQGYMPILMGILTFFLPCGFTQSMQVSAMATGNFLSGAVIMFVFTLGTLPMLALISFTSAKLAEGNKSEIFFKTAGFIVLFFAVFNFYTSLVAAGIILPLF